MSYKKCSSIAFLVGGETAEEAIKNARRAIQINHGHNAYSNIADVTVVNFNSRISYSANEENGEKVS